MTNTNTTPKMTKFQKYEMLSKLDAVQTNEVLAEFVAHEMELLSNRKASPKKQTASQKANAILLENIISAMEPNRLYTIAEMLKEFEFCADLSPQRVSAVLRPAIIDKRIERVEDKRKVFFKVVEG